MKNRKNIIGSIIIIFLVKKLFDELADQQRAAQMHNVAMLSAFSNIIRVNNQTVNFVQPIANIDL